MEHRASSPGKSPVDFRDAIDELLKFVLESSINGSLDIDLGLSDDFCSHLLLSTVETSCPPYKRLALALCEFIDSIALFGTYDKRIQSNQGSDLRNKEDFTDLMLEMESEFFNILKTINFELHVQEPFFTQLRDGTKTVEGRCAVGDYNLIGPGSVILFNKCFVLEVQEVNRYASFFEMLEAETLVKVLPGVESIEEGVQVYRKFYSEEKESYNGVLGIHVSKPASQLYIPLARILSEWSYGVIQSLLGLTSTDGTI